MRLIFQRAYDSYRGATAGLRYFFQRGRRGYSTRDWWSFDLYLAQVIATGCKKFRTESLAHPDYIENAEWRKILYDIEEGFLTYIDVWETSFVEPPSYTQLAKIENAKRLFIVHFEDLWD